MNVTDAIRARRSVRAYAPKKLGEATVRVLLRAATLAPSAMNRQPWMFSVVQDTAQLKRYSDRAKQLLLTTMGNQSKIARYRDMLETPGYNVFYDASTLVVIGVVEPVAYSEADCWLAAATLMLAATEIGIGTCVIGFAIPLLNLPEVKVELGFPADGVAIAPLILGYPAGELSPVPRDEPRILSWSH